MREQLLDALDHREDLAAVDADFVHLFSSWFNRGFLVLRRIDWSTPAMILEKIIRYEAVHAIASWDDLRRRIDPPDRRCYAFFHPALVDEPLIFVEVALTREIPDAIAPILSVQREASQPDKATTATFYSISNCQRGLAGVSFGNFLIKQVVRGDFAREPAAADLRHAVAGAGLRRAGSTASARPKIRRRCRPEDRAALKGLDRPAGGSRRSARAAAGAAAARRGLVLSATRATAAACRSMRWRASISATARGSSGSTGSATCTENGIAQSYGLMVNYLYDLEDIEKNHEAYAEGRRVVASNAVRRLLRGAAADRAGAGGGIIAALPFRARLGSMLRRRCMRAMRPSDELQCQDQHRSFPMPRSISCCARRAASTISRRSR